MNPSWELQSKSDSYFGDFRNVMMVANLIFLLIDVASNIDTYIGDLNKL